jgi:hypothetical protein
LPQQKKTDAELQNAESRRQSGRKRAWDEDEETYPDIDYDSVCPPAKQRRIHLAGAKSEQKPTHDSDDDINYVPTIYESDSDEDDEDPQKQTLKPVEVIDMDYDPIKAENPKTTLRHQPLSAFSHSLSAYRL